MTEPTTPQQQAGVDKMRAQRHETMRVVVDHMCDDNAVIQAARVYRQALQVARARAGDAEALRGGTGTATRDCQEIMETLVLRELARPGIQPRPGPARAEDYHTQEFPHGGKRMDRIDRTLNLDWSDAQYAGDGVYVLDSTHRTGTPSVAVRADRLGLRANIFGRGIRMKTISLWQPYASLIAAGVKTIETRGQPPPKGVIGQRTAIHAAKAIETADVRNRERHHRIAAALNDPEWEQNIPRGAVVCTVILDHAAQVNGPEHNGQVTVDGNHLVAVNEWGDFGPGRWLWFLRDVEPVDPSAPARGRQGFWNWER